MGIFDPRKISDDSYQKKVDSGELTDFKRSDAGGVYTYQTLDDGRIVIKDVEPADNKKGHQQTDFVIKDGRIESITSHPDDD